MFEEGQIQIHTENIFPIIKKAVYSDHEIFLRELVSNSVDAISKRRMASIAGDCEEVDEPSIDIKVDREAKTITISDNGIGMTSEEVKKYINQVAFSSAEEFLEKYKNENEQIIGHFGLGFYSIFMVSDNVELITRSARSNSTGVKWKCDGSPQYSLEEYERSEPGTDVIMHIMEEEIEYIEPSRIRTLIKKYCDYMPVEVKLEGEVINKQNPPWRKDRKELKDQDYIDFYNYLYPYQGDPLFWIHLNTDYPYNLQAILFFPKITGRADWENGEIRLFCNQVFVSNSIKEVVPRYLLPLRGVIDSTDIPLNVSRSALQADRRVKSIGNFVSKKIADRLKELKIEKTEFYAEIWESISPFIKIGAMEDEKFADLVEELILFSTTANQTSINPDSEKSSMLIKANNNYYTTIKDYQLRQEDNSVKRVIYCTDEIAQASALNLWVSQGKEVLKLETVVDTQFIPWLENRHDELNFQRVDSELDDNLKNEISDLADKDGETETSGIKKIVKEAINNEKVTIQVQSLKGNESPPALILLPEQMRRINDIGALMEQRLPGLPEHHVLLINSGHPLVEGLLKLHSGSVIVGVEGISETEKLSKLIANHLYDMAKMAIGGLDPKELSSIQSKSADLMGKLLEKAL